jgi:hypothetical protein
LEPAPALAVGKDHACWLSGDGIVKCWGLKKLELIDGQLFGRFATFGVDVSGFSEPIATITAGWSHTCALTVGGDVKCWG